MNYRKQANDFLIESHTKITTNLLGTFKFFESDTEKRDVYEIILTTYIGSYTFRFGNSLYETEKRLKAIFKDSPKYYPSAYAILACLGNYDHTTLLDFCDMFGLDIDSIKANKLYMDCMAEVTGLKGIYTEKQIESLQEIS